MAANIDGSCIKCNKTGLIVVCNGCKKYLCLKHVNEHKDELEKELEELINQENEFENVLNNNNDSHYLFKDIDLWKKESIELIKQIAKQTKQQLRDLLSQSNEKLLIKTKEIKDNLHLLKQSEDFSEIQLNNLTNQLDKLKKEIYTFILIKPSNNYSLKIDKQQQQQIDQTPSSSQTKPSITSDQKLFPHIEQTYSKGEGSILIKEIDPYGHYIIIQHNGLTTAKDQDMLGWSLIRSIDCYKDIIYRFPSDFILKSKSSIKIVSREAGQTVYSYEKDKVLIAQSIQTWGFGIKQIVNRLIDPNGNDIHIVTQTFK